MEDFCAHLGKVSLAWSQPWEHWLSEQGAPWFTFFKGALWWTTSGVLLVFYFWTSMLMTWVKICENQSNLEHSIYALFLYICNTSMTFTKKY